MSYAERISFRLNFNLICSPIDDSMCQPRSFVFALPVTTTLGSDEAHVTTCDAKEFLQEYRSQVDDQYSDILSRSDCMYMLLVLIQFFIRNMLNIGTNKSVSIHKRTVQNVFLILQTTMTSTRS